MRKFLSPILLLLIFFGCSTNRNSSYLVAPKPILVKHVLPVYPESLYVKDIKGEVWVNAEILADGSVGNVEVKKSLDPDLKEFDEAAINAVKQWKFAPIVGYEEKSFTYTVTVPLKFNSEQISVNNEDLQNKLFLTYESPPKVLKKVAPLYPKRFQKNGIEGEVLLAVEILVDGSVGRIKVEKSLLAGEGGLDECAEYSVKQWKFSPALDGEGNPVTSWVIFPIIFQLK